MKKITLAGTLLVLIAILLIGPETNKQVILAIMAGAFVGSIVMFVGIDSLIFSDREGGIAGVVFGTIFLFWPYATLIDKSQGWNPIVTSLLTSIPFWILYLYFVVSGFVLCFLQKRQKEKRMKKSINLMVFASNDAADSNDHTAGLHVPGSATTVAELERLEDEARKMLSKGVLVYFDDNQPLPGGREDAVKLLDGVPNQIVIPLEEIYS